MKIIRKYDKLLVGLIPGLILPGITFLISWKSAYDGSLKDYYEQFQQLDRLASLLSLCSIPNLLLFFIFIWTNYYKSARGVIFATLVLAILMLIIKYI